LLSGSAQLRGEFSNINIWFEAMEKKTTYLGTQSDFHTHAHDLPPQMGMCVASNSKAQMQTASEIDGGLGVANHFQYETSVAKEEGGLAEREALTRCYIHRKILGVVNPMEDESKFDEALRAALSNLLADSDSDSDSDSVGKLVKPPAGSAVGLRYLRDRVSVPRDMGLHAARVLRAALEKTAALDGAGQGPEIRSSDRRDQNPKPFVMAKELRRNAE